MQARLRISLLRISGTVPRHKGRLTSMCFDMKNSLESSLSPLLKTGATLLFPSENHKLIKVGVSNIQFFFNLFPSAAFIRHYLSDIRFSKTTKNLNQTLNRNTIKQLKEVLNKPRCYISHKLKEKVDILWAPSCNVKKTHTVPCLAKLPPENLAKWFLTLSVSKVQKIASQILVHTYIGICATLPQQHVPIILCMFIFSSSEGLCLFHLVRKKKNLSKTGQKWMKNLFFKYTCCIVVLTWWARKRKFFRKKNMNTQ